MGTSIDRQIRRHNRRLFWSTVWHRKFRRAWRLWRWSL